MILVHLAGLRSVGSLCYVGGKRHDKKHRRCQSQSAWCRTWQGLRATSPDPAISFVQDEGTL